MGGSGPVPPDAHGLVLSNVIAPWQQVLLTFLEFSLHPFNYEITGF